MFHWLFIGIYLALAALLLRRVLPARGAYVLGIAVQVAFTVLALLMAAYCVWCLTAVRSAADAWLVVLVGIYLLFAAAVYLFGRFVGRRLRG